jgi:subfamily B ATP-binding cassette protein MsbA
VFSRTLRRFLAYLRPYRSLVALAVVTGVVRYLIPLALPWAMKVVIDDLLAPGAAKAGTRLDVLMGGLTALYIAYGFISYWRSNLAGVVGHHLIFDLRRDLYLHIQRLSLSFFERQRIGAIVTRLTGDIASAQNFVGAAFVNTAMDVAAIGVIVIVLWVWNWKLALVSLAVLPFYALINQRLNRRIRQQSRLIHDQLQEISGELYEQFGATSTIQSFTQEPAAARSFDRRSNNFLASVLTNVRLQSIALGVAGTLTSIGPILLIWFGAGEVLSGRLTVGTLMAFYAYLGMLYTPVQRLTELNLILSNSLAAMDRIFEVFDTQPEVRERAGARDLGRSRGEIAFEDTSFQYESGPPVLDRVRLHVPAGSTVALVGPSGAGKSTVVKLLPRFYDVTAGRITIDGMDVRDLTLGSLRRNIAIVAQEPLLLSGTIGDNLRYGKADASTDELRHAARLAFADEFILRLPQGYETEIGERGVKLSGGQKQRLAIARAFLKDAPILVLDEPTSALDPESEALIKHALEHLVEGRTALIIAHRLSTIEHADEVVVLDRGRVVERGSHRELVERPDGLYRRYAAKQLVMNR